MNQIQRKLTLQSLDHGEKSFKLVFLPSLNDLITTRCISVFWRVFQSVSCVNISAGWALVWTACHSNYKDDRGQILSVLWFVHLCPPVVRS